VAPVPAKGLVKEKKKRNNSTPYGHVVGLTPCSGTGVFRTMSFGMQVIWEHTSGKYEFIFDPSQPIVNICANKNI
jgi:hypothetical protein